ncbi:MAG: thiamine diphosphokinase [Candidatus Thalassarchaeaceae archaeon]
MRAFLWCNGELHDENLTSKFEDISPLFGVDGGANKAKSVGYNVKEILGDLDSVNIEELNIDGTLLKDQNYSDLTKTINELSKRGFNEFEVLGVDGGDTGHILGIWASLAELSTDLIIRLHHQKSTTHRITCHSGNSKINVGESKLFSVFALTKCDNVTIKDAEWEMINQELKFSTRGLHNKALKEDITITTDGILVVIVQN